MDAKVDMDFVDWQIANVIRVDVVKALANERRLQILEWLQHPRRTSPRRPTAT